MIAKGYTGSTAAKTSLAVLGKVSVTTIALTLGTAVVVVVAATVLFAQTMNIRTWELEDSVRENPETSQT